MIANQVRVSFGKGDVCLNCTYSGGNGILLLHNQAPRAVGPMPYEPGSITPDEIASAPICLTFTNKASIDAFITALNRIREFTQK